MRALSIRQPWAWLILNAGKDIENRSWPTRYRGRFLIHASKGMTRSEYDDGCESLRGLGHIAMPDFKSLERGGVVGAATIVDCVDHSKSRWFFGDYGFVLTDVRPLSFRAVNGQLGWFDVSITESELEQKT